MENNIVKSWDLVEFAKMKGKPSLGTFNCTNSAGEQFTAKSVVFTDPSNPDNQTNKCFVGFSRNLGELTTSEIVARKNELQVVQLESGSHILCKKGANAWEDFEL